MIVAVSLLLLLVISSMDNRIVFIHPDNRVIVRAPCPGWRNCTSVRRTDTNITVTSTRPLPLWHFVSHLRMGLTSEQTLNLIEVLAGETIPEFLTRVENRNKPSNTMIRRTLKQNLPSRRFRESWRWNGTQIDVGIPLAKAQILAEVRQKRNQKILESDSDRARLEDIGTAQQKQDLANYRQALRDFPAVVQQDLAPMTTVAELQAYTPNYPVAPS